MHAMPKAQFVSTRVAPRNSSSQSVSSGTATTAPIDRDVQFLSLLAGFRRSGGLDRAHDVGIWLEGHTGPKVGTLARWMANNDVIHFDWQLQTWLPMFQFDATTRAPHVAVGLVLIEFESRFEHRDVAQWFATPSSALGGGIPAAVLSADPALVIDAARQEKSLLGHSVNSVNSLSSGDAGDAGNSGNTGNTGN